MNEQLRLLQLQVALLQAQIDMLQANMDLIDNQEERRQRRWWSRAWLGPERRRQFGLYDQLMTELRREDESAFLNFMRLPPAMYDELLQRVEPRITKQTTFYRAPLEPGLKLAITLRHLASGSKFNDMRYGWRVPHNTISILVRQVNNFH